MPTPPRQLPHLARYAGVGALACTLLSAGLIHDRVIMNAAPPAALTDAANATATAEEQVPAAAAATTAATAPQIVSYTVATGDTLSEIAAKYNTDVTSIMTLNSLTRSSSLKIGQTLRILTTKGIVYQVKSGDSISRLAIVYGVSADEIIKANQLASADKLKLGQELIIPGAKAATVATTSRGDISRPSTTKSTTSTTSKPSTSSGYLWPVRGPITSGFGSRWGSIHTGVDIGVSTGTPVKASRAGTVIQAGWNGGYGYSVTISHGGGVTTLYGHNSKLLVKVGDKVSAGQVIARSGSTGRSTGPHVHFEVRINGKAINPLTKLR